MKRSTSWKHCLCAVAWFVASCGGATAAPSAGDAGAGDATRAPISPADFPAALAAAFCDSMGECCRDLGHGYDVTACRASLRSHFVNIYGDGDARATFDADAAAACVRAAETVARTCDFSRISVETACASVYRGSVERGGACPIPVECSTPDGGFAWCAQGKCNALAPGGEGEACDETCWRVGEETWCGEDSEASGVAHGKVGCFQEDGLYCDGANRCARVEAIGAACTMHACARDAYCRAGTCAAKVKQAGSCAGYFACVDGLTCIAGACGTPLPNGAACGEIFECASGYCSQGVCDSVHVGPLGAALRRCAGDPTAP